MSSLKPREPKQTAIDQSGVPRRSSASFAAWSAPVTRQRRSNGSCCKRPRSAGRRRCRSNRRRGGWRGEVVNKNRLMQVLYQPIELDVSQKDLDKPFTIKGTPYRSIL